MKSSVIIAFVPMTTIYSQQLKFLEANKNLENAADSINSFIEKKRIESGIVGLAA